MNHTANKARQSDFRKLSYFLKKYKKNSQFIPAVAGSAKSNRDLSKVLFNEVGHALNSKSI